MCVGPLNHVQNGHDLLKGHELTQLKLIAVLDVLFCSMSTHVL